MENKNEKCMNCTEHFDINLAGCVCPKCFLEGFTPRQLADQNNKFREACLMAREELVFGGDWITAKRILNEALKTPK